MDQILIILISLAVIVLCLMLLFMSTIMVKLLKSLNEKKTHPYHPSHHQAKIDTSEMQKIMQESVENQIKQFTQDIANIQNSYKEIIVTVQKDNINVLNTASKDIEKALIN